MYRWTLGDEKVREMALRAAGLSDRSLKAITDMIDSARSVEGLPGSVGATEGAEPLPACEAARDDNLEHAR